jgi:transketolase
MQTIELQKVASQVRRDILRQVHGCQSGHPGGSLGCTDLLVELYFNSMTLKTDASGKVVFQMDGLNEDVFFLSNGHISPLLYSVLARRGYFPVAELASFRKLNTRLQGHPTPHEHLEGIRIASGSLGQGLSVAIGVAQAKKLNGDSSIVYCLMGDGEQNEGQVWEAAMYAPHHQVNNLIAFIENDFYIQHLLFLILSKKCHICIEIRKSSCKCTSFSLFIPNFKLFFTISNLKQ